MCISICMFILIRTQLFNCYIRKTRDNSFRSQLYSEITKISELIDCSQLCFIPANRSENSELLLPYKNRIFVTHPWEVFNNILMADTGVERSVAICIR